MRRTQEQWQTLIQAQQASGLSAIAFCQQHNLCHKYFSLRKRQLRQASEAAFVPLVQAEGGQGVAASGEITFRYGHCTIEFIRAPSVAWLAALMQALA